MFEIGKYYRFLSDIKCHANDCDIELFYRGTWINKNSIALILEAPTKSKYPNTFYIKFLQEGKIYYVLYITGSRMDTCPQAIFKRVDE